MIKPILCSLAILLSFSNIFAQERPIKFGAKFGFSHSNVDMPQEVTQYDGFGSTDNFHLGVVSELDLNNNFGLKAEVLYSQKGGEAFYLFDPNNQNITQDDERLRFNFITFPLLMTYQFSNFQVEGGIETAFRQNAKFIIEGTKFKVNAAEDRIDFGLNVGLNYILKPLVIGVRYNHGLRAMPLDLIFTDENGVFLDPQPRFLNRVWQFSVMYRI